ncbi:hypothetical protein AHMF7605_23240 [Adhaeribacter arboris]|uniref:Penicillin-binding protein n=2 Tax=Adhaeribacter arboris TaxID=2072846 RepID=A0A2T2YL30_9BACT|nr:hypothetical protein AHMF7605_23240 [Adhaeribacter arboris]
MVNAFTTAAQMGGHHTFDFLSLPAGARLTGLGGSNVSVPSTDVTMLQANPALLQSSMQKQLALSYTDYLADISLSSVYYALDHPKLGRWGAGLQYLNYGDFTQTDPTGQVTGKFAVQDYVVSITHASVLKPFTLGATLKFALSGIAEYKSSAILMDLGGVYKHPDKEFYMGLVLKNIGYPLKTFTGGARESMPFDAQIGLTYKPEHMPLQFSVTAHHLQQFDIGYQDTTQSGTIISGSQQKSLGDKLARHFVMGGQFILSKNFNVMVGYNHLRNRELRLETKAGGAGFALGATVRIKAFELAYTRAYYHVAGASNTFTVITQVAQVFRKKSRV